MKSSIFYSTLYTLNFLTLLTVDKINMAEKKKFLLRIDESIYTALEKWAADDLRSINAQIEFLLKDSLRKNNRLKETKENGNTTNESDSQKN